MTDDGLEDLRRAIGPVDGPAEASSSGGEQRVGGWVLEREIGRGGLGTVYLARRTEDEDVEPHALKLFRGGVNRERFERSCALARELDHPNLTRVVDGGVDRDRPFLVMQLCEGVSLASLRQARGGTLPPEEARPIVLGVASALDHLHASNVIHRDVKPSNVIIGPDGAVQLTDFDLLRTIDDDHGVTKTGTALGTAAYMSPEQVRGRDIDHRSDLFSLGALFFELLAGHPPYGRGSIVSLASRILTERPDSIAEVADVPAADADLIDRLLASDPDERPSSAGEVIAILDQRASGPEAGSAGRTSSRAGAGSGRRLQRSSSGRLGSTGRSSRRTSSRRAAAVSERRVAGATARGPGGLVGLAAVFGGLALVGGLAATIVTGPDPASPSPDAPIAGSTRSAIGADPVAPEAAPPTGPPAGDASTGKGPSEPVTPVEPPAFEELIRRASAHGARGEWEAAAGSAREALALRPDHPFATMLLRQARENGVAADPSPASRADASRPATAPRSDETPGPVIGGGPEREPPAAAAPPPPPLDPHDPTELRRFERRFVISAHPEGVFDLEWAPDGDRLASASDDGVRIWDGATGRGLAHLDDRGTRALTWSGQGDVIVTTGGGRIGLWDAATGRRTTLSSKRSAREITDVAFASDGRSLVTSGGGLWNEHLDLLRPAGPGLRVARRPGAETIATGLDAVELRAGPRFDVLEVAWVVEGDRVEAIAFSSDGEHLAVGLGSGKLLLVDPEVGGASRTVEAPARSDGGEAGGVAAVVFDAAGGIVAVGAIGRGEVTLVDVASGAPVGGLPLASSGEGLAANVASLALSPDGRSLAVGCADGTVEIWSGMPRGQAIREPELVPDPDPDAGGPGDPDGGGGEPAPEPDGPLDWIEVALAHEGSGASGDALAAWKKAWKARPHDPLIRDSLARISEQLGADPTAFAVLDSFRHPAGDVFLVAADGDGRRVAAASRGGTVVVWDTRTGAILAERAHDVDVNALALSPDGLTVAAGGESKKIEVWGVERGELLFERVTPFRVTALDFAPDGEVLAAASGPAELLDARTGKLRGELELDFAAQTMRFSPSGKLISVAAWNGPVLAFHPRGGRAWTGGTDDESFAGAASESLVAIVTRSGTIRVHDAADGAVVASFPHPDQAGRFGSIAFGPGGSLVTAGGAVRFWDPRSGSKAHELALSTASVAAGRGGRFLVTGSFSGEVSLIGAPGLVDPDRPPVASLASTPDAVAARLLALADADLAEGRPRSAKAGYELVTATLSETETYRARRREIRDVLRDAERAIRNAETEAKAAFARATRVGRTDPDRGRALLRAFLDSHRRSDVVRQRRSEIVDRLESGDDD